MKNIEMVALTNIKGEHTPILFFLEDSKGIKRKYVISWNKNNSTGNNIKYITSVA